MSININIGTAATKDAPDTFDFAQIFDHEISVINERRQTRPVPGAQIALTQVVTDSGAMLDVTGRPVLRPSEDANLIGLSLSGGGIRSAAFSLGVLQALN